MHHNQYNAMVYYNNEINNNNRIMRLPVNVDVGAEAGAVVFGGSVGTGVVGFT
ncbi:MAG: hypothetical protein MUO21_06440 [Nitrososphaeraceae archaeon]|nr:hypothetical protein [Nitrososphaeraceae archaeon]